MHIPVLLEEVVAALAVRPGGVVIDATLGSAGHAAVLLEAAGAGGRLLGIDRDPAALRRAGGRLAPFGERAMTVHGNHAELAGLARAHGCVPADAILIDTGVSSDQLDTPERGFSFQSDAPLDMRMDPTRGESAAELLARLDADGLADLLRRYGEEPHPRAMARAIVRARERAPIETTGRLAEVVAAAAGGFPRRHHPATRVFQALRMAVNRELESLQEALDGALSVLAPDGRLAVITFESLSDRVVKQTFTAHVGRDAALPQGGSAWQGERPAVAWVVHRPAQAGEAELAANPRSRSAKLRAVRRLRPEEEPFPT